MNKIILIFVCFLILVPNQVIKADDSINDSLIKAAADCNLSRVKYALSQGADIGAQNESVDLVAMSNGSYKCIKVMKLLLNNGVDINAPIGNDGATALMTATLLNGIRMVKFLLSYGADVNLVNNSGWTALITASLLGEVTIVKLLLSHGADVNVKASDKKDLGDKVITALSVAEMKKHLDPAKYGVIIKLLKAAGAKE